MSSTYVGDMIDHVVSSCLPHWETNVSIVHIVGGKCVRSSCEECAD